MTKLSTEKMFLLDQLFVSGAFSIPEVPVVDAAGRICPFELEPAKMAMTERLPKKPKALLQFAADRTHEHVAFGKVAEVLSDEVTSALSSSKDTDEAETEEVLMAGVVGDGLVFAGAMSYLFGEQDVVTYDGSSLCLRNGQYNRKNPQLRGSQVIPVMGVLEPSIVDLVSHIDNNEGVVDHVVALVNTGQVGRNEMAELKVKQHYALELAEIVDAAISAGVVKGDDAAKLRSFMSRPNRWGRRYILKRDGIEPFVYIFAPEADPQRRRRFLDLYDGVLEDSGRGEELDQAVATTFGATIPEMIGD